MSIVLNVLYGSKSYLMCDGRQIDINSNNIVTEDCKKIFRISDNVAVGMTGRYEYGASILNQISHYRDQIQYADTALTIILDAAKKFLPQYSRVNDKLSMIVTGITSNNILITYIFKAPEFEPKDYTCPNNGDLTHNMLYNILPDEPFESAFLRKFSVYAPTIDERILAGMAEYISVASKYDNTVNSNTFSVIIDSQSNTLLSLRQM